MSRQKIMWASGGKTDKDAEMEAEKERRKSDRERGGRAAKQIQRANPFVPFTRQTMNI